MPVEFRRDIYYATFDRIVPALDKEMALLYNGAGAGYELEIQRIMVFHWQVLAGVGVPLDFEWNRITNGTTPSAGTDVTPRKRRTGAAELPSGILAKHAAATVTVGHMIRRFITTNEEVVAGSLDVHALGLSPVLYERKPGEFGYCLANGEGISLKCKTGSVVGSCSFMIEFCLN